MCVVYEYLQRCPVSIDCWVIVGFHWYIISCQLSWRVMQCGMVKASSSGNMATWSDTIHTHPFNVPCPGLPRWAGTRKVKPIWILLKQETVSGSGISWAICKSAHCSRQITMPAPTTQFLQAFPAAQPTTSKHWRQTCDTNTNKQKQRI